MATLIASQVIIHKKPKVAPDCFRLLLIAPQVIIHKKRPPPGSVPVGLHLPPLSFHHVDADTLHLLDRMQVCAWPLMTRSMTL